MQIALFLHYLLLLVFLPLCTLWLNHSPQKHLYGTTVRRSIRKKKEVQSVVSGLGDSRMAFVRLERVCMLADLSILRGHQRWRIEVYFDLLPPVSREEAAEWSSGIIVKDIPTSYGISRALNVREPPMFLSTEINSR
ncbi:hypothetical protein DFH08DRAFT_818781 [Mycena albidolilacea]|uniref:Uncharacterized protein n=1 Tax=Mycena albidolilacea TaxID=1033008 RepID=A0AAD7EG27_9AGAR|nr:hypothetical protein DFH08DRAFT_818781 [Mycena albidolilacea]